jgi:hypothetical protein
MSATATSGPVFSEGGVLDMEEGHEVNCRENETNEKGGRRERGTRREGTRYVMHRR